MSEVNIRSSVTEAFAVSWWANAILKPASATLVASFKERLVYKGKDNHMQQSANRQNSDNSDSRLKTKRVKMARFTHHS